MPYGRFTVCLPFLWWLAVALVRGYETRIVGLGSDEFQRVFNAAVGQADGVAHLTTELRREPHHGLAVVGACLTAGVARSQVAAVPVCGGLERIESAVSDLHADTVAVLACPS